MNLKSSFDGLPDPQQTRNTRLSIGGVWILSLWFLSGAARGAEFENPPGHIGGGSADTSIEWACPILFPRDKLLTNIVWFGGPTEGAPLETPARRFEVRIYEDRESSPGTVLASFDMGQGSGRKTGDYLRRDDLGRTGVEYVYSGSFQPIFHAEQGKRYWLSIVNTGVNYWLWEASYRTYATGAGSQFRYGVPIPPGDWTERELIFAFQLNSETNFAFPVILDQPGPSVKILSEGQPATIEVTAGGPNLSFQWYHDSIAMPGRTSAKLAFEQLQPGDVGKYFLAIANPSGSVWSENVEIILVTPQVYGGLTLSGRTGAFYRIEFSDELKNPTAWQPLTNITLSTSPQEFIDVTSKGHSKRFYRFLPCYFPCSFNP